MLHFFVILLLSIVV